MPKPITVLVTGATGRQGGAVARLLLDKGHHVRALTRRPGSQAAAGLHVLGAEIFEGDFDDPASVRSAAQGADAFFLVATPFQEGVAAEVRQGKRAADAAKSAGVGHLVYSSVASADRRTGIPHFDSKREIETYIEALGVPYTIVAPAFFMENFLGPTFEQGLREGALAMPLPPARKLQMVAVDDIAAFVRLVLERPTELAGKRIDLASDSLTGPEIAKALSHGTGATVRYSPTPVGVVRAQSEDSGRMWEWFDRVGYAADIDALRREYPEAGWHDFARWVHEQDWTAVEADSSQRTP